MANLLGQVGAGAVMGGAAANMKTLRDEAEELRKNSYLKLMQQYQQDNMRLNDQLATDRDATKRLNDQQDAMTERKWNNEDKQWEFDKRKGLIGYEAGVKKNNSVIGYDDNGKPITFGEADKYEKIYGSPVGRESSKPISVEQAKWNWLQEHGTEEDKRKAAGGNVTSADKVEMKPAQALKEVATIDMQIGNLKKGNMLTEEGMTSILQKMPELAPFVNMKSEMSQEDKDQVIKSLLTYRDYVSRFLPNQESGIIAPQKDEVGDTIDSLLQR